MKAAVDLHIHSALSPCSDNDMTPNNIVNMSKLKELDIIAVTDHNALENFRALEACAREAGLLLVPGMELETREEVHLVCLFRTPEEALKMGQVVFAALPDIPNREEIFGDQLIMDQEDEVTGKISKLLLNATSLSVEEAFSYVEALRGVVIPAHVDRDSYSILSNLGWIPETLPVRTLEISKDCNLDSFMEKHPDLSRYRFIRSSDAHHLGNILERECFLELPELSIDSLIDTLRAGKE